MKLYNHKVSPFARLCQVVVNLTKTECESYWLDLNKGEQKTEWYLEINPKGKVPSLQLDDGTVLTESTVICKFLCRNAGENSLYPNDIVKQSKVDEAIADAKELSWFYFAKIKFFGGAESAEELKKLEDSYAKVTKLCFSEGNKWIFGDTCTLADLELAVRISMAIDIGGYDVRAKFPEIMKGYDEITKMPEWKAVNDDMLEKLAEMQAQKQ